MKASEVSINLVNIDVTCKMTLPLPKCVFMLNSKYTCQENQENRIKGPTPGHEPVKETLSHPNPYTTKSFIHKVYVVQVIIFLLKCQISS